MSPRAATAAVLILLVLLAGCGRDDPGADGRIVLATTTQVADLTRQVAGTRTEVRQVLHPNSDPHDYEPRPSDAEAVTDAAVVFRSGGELDDWLGDLVEGAGGETPVVSLMGAVGAPGKDPHWWQDPRKAVRAVSVIRDALTEADPGGRSDYARTAATYTRRLRSLDRMVAACIRRLPPPRRRLVTTHDALGHYAGRYGIEVIGALIPSRSSEAQASAGDTADLVRQIRKEDVRAIFPESALNPKLERAVSREAGVEVGDPLWADTLGEGGSSGATYIDSIAANTAALVKGLSGGRLRCKPRA
jgi:ABC-type Zn uptake system ZnuABC Zn-binding protein ZnuA